MDQSMDLLPQHSFLSNFEGFRTNFENYLKEQVTGNVDYLGLCYVLMGYFSTMQKDHVYDQVIRDHVQILHVLVAGHRDRFFLLFVTKTLITGQLNGRLFNFRLNRDVPKFDHRNLFLEDAEFLVNLLRRNDPTMDWGKCAEWLLNVRNRCLFVELNKEMKIEAQFYRISQMFQESRSGEMLWRELKTTPDVISLFQELDYTNFDRKIIKIYNILHEVFVRNSENELNGMKFQIIKENLLRFIYGALKFTIAPYFPMKILPIHIGPNLNKLALLPQQREEWTVRQNLMPVILDVYRTVEEKLENEEYAETFDLPVGFACGAKKALVCSLTLQDTNENLKISRTYVEIPSNNGLLDLLIKLSTFDGDHFHQSIEHYRRELLLQLDRIDTFLGHKHRMETLRHFIFASLMTLGEGYSVYKLKRSFSSAVDVFVIKSGSDGIIIQLSHDALDEPTATALEKCITDTGLQKFVVLSLNDRAYSYSIQSEATLNPTLGMVANEYQPQEMSSTFLETSVWTEVSRLFDGNWFMKILIYPRYQKFRSGRWVEELAVHSMVPENQDQYLAQVKGLTAEKQVFQPYSSDFLGLRVEKYRTREGIRVSNSRKTFHILLDTSLMITRDQSDSMSKLKTFFKKELSHSIKKLNTELVRMTPTWNRRGEFSIKFIQSSPAGIDRDEYESCYTTRRKRASEGCLKVADETQEQHDVGRTDRYSVSKIINTAMYIQMAKGIIGSALDGDFRRMLKEAGIITGMLALSFMGDQSVRWGQTLLKNGHIVKGRSAYLLGKTTSKAYLGFVISDLISRAKALEHGDKDQLFGIIGDSAILTINAVAIRAEIYSTFSTIEEASIELGPEVMIAEAVIFAVVDGYYSIKTVQKIEEQISLSWGEDVVQWLRSFLTAHESDYIRKLIQEKALLQMSVQDMASKFALHNYSYQFYATPSLYVDNEMRARQMENNFIDLNQRIDIESRTWPQTNQSLHVECASPNEYEKLIQEKSWWRTFSDKLGFTADGTIQKSIVCKNMVSISAADKKQSAAGTALLELGSGDDIAIGFENKNNLFILSGGNKRITGGKHSDTFLLVENASKVVGSLDGLEGDNILDLSRYLPSQPLSIDLGRNILKYDNHTILNLAGITHVIGRTRMTDNVACDCGTRYLDLGGGYSVEYPDQITIPNMNCSQDISLKLSGSVYVENSAKKSNVVYLVQNNTSASIASLSRDSDNIFILPMELEDMESFIRQSSYVKLKSEIHEIKITVHKQADRCRFVFSDEFQMHYAENNFQATLWVKNNSQIDRQWIDEFLLLSRKLGIIINIISDDKHIQIHNLMKSSNSEVNYFRNDADYRTTLITNDNSRNYFQINASCISSNTEVNCRMEDVFISILNDSKSACNTLDLSAVEAVFSNSAMKFAWLVENTTDTLTIKLIHGQIIYGKIQVRYDNSLLNDASCSKLLLNIKILMQLCYDSTKDKFTIHPVPIKLDERSKTLVLSREDIVVNMDISINKRKTYMKCQSYKDSLILTNLNLDDRIDEQNNLTLIFVDYFGSNEASNQTINVFDSLKFEFENSQIMNISKFVEDCQFLIEHLDFS